MNSHKLTSAQFTTQERSPAATPASPAAAALAHRLGNHYLQRLLQSRVLQAKLTVSDPGDAFEQEADRVADHVMRVPEPASVQRSPDDPYEREADRIAERLTDSSDRRVSEDSEPTVGNAPLSIRRFTATPTAAPTAVPDSVNRALSGTGSALEPGLQGDMERRFGCDFSMVRVHSDADADRSARDLNAEAYTAGSDIVFGAGRFAPETQEGRRLLVHELTHVVQQSGGARRSPVEPHRIQCKKKRTETNLSIIKIVAFQGELFGEAMLSDGTVERVALSKNELAPGPYIFERDFTARYYYRRSDTSERPGNFRWYPKTIFEGEFDRAETVVVEILEGSLSTLRARIGALPEHVQHHLTTGEGPAASYEELRDIAAAGSILEEAGVTEDELLLLEARSAEAASEGESADRTDPVTWARAFVARRQQAGEEALGRRRTLVAARDLVETLPPKTAGLIRNLIIEAGDKKYGWETIQGVFENNGVSLSSFIAEFEFELSAITHTFLSQALVALFRVEQTYLANRNVGAERERLRRAIAATRPSVFQREAGAAELKRQVGEHAWGRADEAKVEEWRKEVAQREENLQQESQAAGLPVASWKGFDPDLILNPDVDAARRGLRAFVFDARSRLQRAERMAADIKNLYKFDKMVTLAKSASGISKGSLLGDVIDFRAKLETADDGFWSTLWEIITVALMFVPGNFGIALRAATGLVNMSKAADEYVGAKTRSMTGLSSEDPSSFGFYLAVGGTLIEAPQMARGVFKVAGGEAAGAATAVRGTASAESTAVREGEQAVAAAGESATAKRVVAETPRPVEPTSPRVVENPTPTAEAPVPTEAPAPDLGAALATESAAVREGEQSLAKVTGEAADQPLAQSAQDVTAARRTEYKPSEPTAPVATEPAAGVPVADAPPVIKPDPRLAQAEERLATAQEKAEAARGRLQAASEKSAEAEQATVLADAELAAARQEANVARAERARAEKAYDRAKPGARAAPRAEYTAAKNAAEKAERKVAGAAKRAKSAKKAQQEAVGAVPRQEATVGRAQRAVTAAEEQRLIELEADRIRKLPRNVEGLPPSWDYDRFPNGPRRDWKPGDAVDMPDAKGVYPVYPTVRKRIWRTLATDELAERAAGRRVRATIPPRPKGPVDPHAFEEVPKGGLPWLDPIREATDKELAAVARSGSMPSRLGAEIEHARIPQRAGDMLEAVGVDPNTARRVTKVGDPENLMPTRKEIHSILDEWARVRNPNRNPTLKFSLDVRATASFREATDAEIADIVKAIKNRRIAGRETAEEKQALEELRGLLEAEKKLRPSSTWEVP